MALKSIMNFVMTDHCYHKYFVEFDFFDVPCFSAVLSKLLGYGIVLGAVLVKVPQIQKIYSAKSAVGVSFTSLLFEIFAVSSMLCYSYAKEFPFSAWGDCFFMSIQNTVLGFLIQHYNGRTNLGIMFVLVYGVIMLILTSPIAPIRLLAAFQAINTPAVLVSKLMQAYNNFRNGSTGQLSAITIFLIFLGSLTRIFTSIQETGDMLVIVNFMVASTCNGILVLQMLWYWNADGQKKKVE